MSEDDESLLPISALQHLLFCERQCALIHTEQVWAENLLTAEGNLLHERAHDGPDEHRTGVHITRGLAVQSLQLGLSGQCDVVEFHLREGVRPPHGLACLAPDSFLRVLPIEYKRGRPKSHRADEVQLCAQALCLEEMLGCHIEAGHLYYGQQRQRTEILLDEELRALTRDTATRLCNLLASGRTPPAKYARNTCEHCSLIGICMPRANQRRGGAEQWFDQTVTRTLED